MEYKIRSAKITSQTDDSKWGGCFAENGFLVVLEVSGGGIEAKARGKAILDLLLIAFSSQKDRNTQTISNILSEIKDRASIDSLVIALVSGNRIYLGSILNGEAILERNGKFGKILSGQDISEGEILEKDKLLLSSATFSSIKWEYRKHMFLSSDPDTAVEAVAPFALQENMKGSSALYVTFEKADEESRESEDLAPSDRGKNIKTKLQDLVRRILDNSRFSPGFENNSKKKLFLMALVIFLILIASIWTNAGKNRSKYRQEKLQETLDLVSHQYEEAVNLVDLNPVRARSLLSAGKIGLTPLLKEFPKNSDELKRVEEWIAKVSEAEVAAFKIFKLTAVPLFFDLNLIKTGGVTSRADIFENDIAMLDLPGRSVYSLSTSTKKASIIAGDTSVGTSGNITVYGDYVYTLNPSGIIKIDKDSKKAEIIKDTDPQWGEIVSMDAYAGNIYLLDKVKNAIWKYMSTDEGLSERYSYLNADTPADFSESIKLEIDGSVWVVNPEGLARYTRGLPDPFEIKDFSDTVSDIVSASVIEENRNIYLLEKNIPRIIVFNKDGEYQSQYQWDDLKDASDIIASEKDKKIYVFIQGRIYAIEIK